MEITAEEFNEYLAVQDSGMFNMFEPRAREMTSLSKKKWVHIISNYNELSDKYKGENEWKHYQNNNVIILLTE